MAKTDPTKAVSPKPLLRTEAPDPVDIHVGGRLRLRRNLLGLSQEQLGKASHLTFQQIQKYERGTNRMGSSRLYQISKILDVPISWFFDGLAEGEHTPQASLEGAPETNQNPQRLEADQILHRRETTDLLRAWYRISDPKQRRKIMDLIKSMGDDN